MYYESVQHNANKSENNIIYQHLIDKCQLYYELTYF